MTGPHDRTDAESMPLPPPDCDTPGSLQEAIAKRRSVRQFATASIDLPSVATLLWSAQGVTGTRGRRTAPSAGGLHPLQIQVLAVRVETLDPGLYRYQPDQHALVSVQPGHLEARLAAASWGQDFLRDAAAIFIISAVHARTTVKYGERGIRYVQLEAGHAAQNLCLMATQLGLRSVVTGAFGDADVQRVLQMPADEIPLVLLPVGGCPPSNTSIDGLGEHVFTAAQELPPKG